MKATVREHKERVVNELADKLERSRMAILTDYRGLKVSDLNALRGRLRAVGAEYSVAKNTMTRFAAQRLGREGMVADLAGPTAIAFAYEDPAAATRALQDYIRATRSPMVIKGAVLGRQRLSPEEVGRFADLPSKEQLQAQLVGTVMSPMSSLVGVMNAVLSSVVYVLEERAKQLGGVEAAAS